MGRTYMPIVAGALLWGSVTAGAQGGGNAQAAAVKNPVPSTPMSIAQGQRLYQSNCRQCHGARGAGDGPFAPKNPSPPNLTDAEWKFGSSDGEIFAVIANGAGPDSPMKAMRRSLSDNDIWNVVNYLRSLAK